jgi:tetrahydrodipicolinate N-succinyltransferase
VLAFINFEIKDSKDKLVKGCPFQLVMRLLSSFQSMFIYTEVEFSQMFAQSVCVAITTRLDNLQESEIKELEKDILHEVIQVFKEYMLIIQSPEEADQAAELRELQVAQKYLKCPFFEKRVRGINEFKEIYFKVMNASIKQRAQNAD